MTTAEQNLRPIAISRPKFSWDTGVQWLVVIVTALLVAFPAWPIVLQSFMSKPLYDKERAFTFDNYTNLLGNARFWDVLVYTAAFAVVTTIIAVIVGIVLAVIINRTNIPLRNLYSNLVTIPYYVSPLVLAFAWMQMYGPQGFGTILVRTLKLPIWQLYSFGGIVIVSAMYYIPYTFLYATSSLALADPQLESAARIGGASPFRTIWSVTIPLLRPAITYSALLTLVSSFELLSIPLVLGNSVGIDTLATYLYVIGVVGVKVAGLRSVAPDQFAYKRRLARHGLHVQVQYKVRMVDQFDQSHAVRTRLNEVRIGWRQWLHANLYTQIGNTRHCVAKRFGGP